MSMKMKPLALGGVALVLVAGWAGASWSTQRAVANKLRDAALIDPSSGIRVATTQSHFGLLQAWGEMDILLHPQCLGTSAAQAADTKIAHLTYQVNQGFNPFGARHIHWQMDVAPPADLATGPSALPTAALTPPPPAKPPVVVLVAQGDGTLDADGNTDQQITLAPNATLMGATRLTMTPIDVHARVVPAKSVKVDVVWPSIHVANRESVDIKNVAAHIEMNGSRYDGTSAFSIDDITSRQLTAHGFRAEATMKADKDILGAKVTYRLASAKAGNKSLSNLGLDVSFDGIAIADLQRLNSAADGRCGVQHTAAGTPDTQALTAAITQVLRRGFHVAIDKVSGTLEDGSVDGATQLEVLATPDGQPLNAAKMLKASGHLRLKGDSVMPAGREEMVQRHFLVADGDAVTSEFTFVDGKLVVNGTPVALPFMDLMQAKMDAALQGPAAAMGGASSEAQAPQGSRSLR